MAGAKLIERTPWDSAALGCDAFELANPGAEALALVGPPGHYTVRVEPLASRELLHRNGFYYCDTLVEPYCAAGQLRLHQHPAAGFDRHPPLEPLLAVCRVGFRHDRFHRDFNVDRRRADLRYENWLKTLHAAAKVYGLVWENETAGFIAHEGGKLVLHAIDDKHRGQGIAKHLWSAVCADLARDGAGEISSSISVTNTAALNLYASLGFSFRNPSDIYHRVIP
jgi:ribosomal protein S18 acetylase RimI-like enzyme